MIKFENAGLKAPFSDLHRHLFAHSHLPFHTTPSKQTNGDSNHKGRCVCALRAQTTKHKLAILYIVKFLDLFCLYFSHLQFIRLLSTSKQRWLILLKNYSV